MAGIDFRASTIWAARAHRMMGAKSVFRS